MDLPNLQNVERDKLKRLAEVLKGAHTGNVGPIEYKFGSKRVEAETKIQDALLKAMVGYSGDWSVKGQMPLWGGNMNLSAQKNEGRPSYGLQFQRNF